MSKLIRLHHFGGKEVLRTEELNVSQPDAGEVLVSVRAASVNRVDFNIRSGKYPSVRDDRLPYTLGRDIAGIVEKCGAQVTRFKVGDEVFGMVGIHGGVRALRYTVEADGSELAEIATLVAAGKVRPHVQKTFPLTAAADALASVEQGHSVGKVVLKVA